jgi:outer membrane protein assembly factor BamE
MLHSMPTFTPKTVTALAIALAFFLAGCSNLRFPGVYRIDIEQGNIVTQEMVDKLRPGLSEAQVRYVMGSPQVVDPFEPGRWVYLYKLRRGNGELVESKFVVWLEGGSLTRWEGQALPESARRRITSNPAPAAPASTDGSYTPP